jgi:4-hydroxybenzoate polyprenyltransferase
MVAPVPAAVEAPVVFAVQPGLRLAALRDLLRPVTLAPVLVIALLFGLMGAGRIVAGYDLARLVLAGGLLVVANGLSNVVNGLGDWVEDSVHPTKQDRPTVNGAFDPAGLLSVAVLGWGAAVLVSVLFLPPAFTVLYIVVLGFAYVYSFPPRLKARFPANMLCISTPRGALGIAAAWCVLGSFWDPPLWLVLAVTVPYVLLANESRNIADADADRYAGVRTIATIWGEGTSRLVTAAGFLAPALVVLAGARTYLGADPWLVATVPLAAAGGYAALRWDGVRVWRLFYVGFALVAVLFFLPLVA